MLQLHRTTLNKVGHRQHNLFQKFRVRLPQQWDQLYVNLTFIHMLKRLPLTECKLDNKVDRDYLCLV